jgi:hypothetical protein
MVVSGRKAVTSAGTKVALASVTTFAGWCTVCADKDNTGTVYVGGDTIQNAAAPGGYIGYPLAKGEFVNLREMGGAAYLDLKHIYIDADTNADAVTFNYGVR